MCLGPFFLFFSQHQVASALALESHTEYRLWLMAYARYLTQEGTIFLLLILFILRLLSIGMSACCVSVMNHDAFFSLCNYGIIFKFCITILCCLSFVLEPMFVV